jgi:hypothetical protein
MAVRKALREEAQEPYKAAVEEVFWELVAALVAVHQLHMIHQLVFFTVNLAGRMALELVTRLGGVELLEVKHPQHLHRTVDVLFKVALVVPAVVV